MRKVTLILAALLLALAMAAMLVVAYQTLR